MKITKQVRNDLRDQVDGEDRNAVINTWTRKAIEEGWNGLEIKHVLSKTHAGDFYHLLGVIQQYSY